MFRVIPKYSRTVPPAVIYCDLKKQFNHWKPFINSSKTLYSFVLTSCDGLCIEFTFCFLICKAKGGLVE